MSVAAHILTGDAAHLVAIQADRVTHASGYDIVRLRTPDLRLAVYSRERGYLVIYDAAALVSLAAAEIIEHVRARKAQIYDNHGRVVDIGG